MDRIACMPRTRCLVFSFPGSTRVSEEQREETLAKVGRCRRRRRRFGTHHAEAEVLARRGDAVEATVDGRIHGSDDGRGSLDQGGVREEMRWAG